MVEGKVYTVAEMTIHHHHVGVYCCYTYSKLAMHNKCKDLCPYMFISFLYFLLLCRLSVLAPPADLDELLACLCSFHLRLLDRFTKGEDFGGKI